MIGQKTANHDRQQEIIDLFATKIISLKNLWNFQKLMRMSVSIAASTTRSFRVSRAFAPDRG